MKKSILITLCCASLMLVTPLTAVAQENQVSSNLPEQPNDVEGLVAQLRVVIDEILQRYGHIPMVSSLCNVVLNSLGLIGEIIFCIFLIILLIPLYLLFDFFMSIGIWSYTINMLLIAVLLLMGGYCPDLFPQSFKSTFPMLETKDNINTFDGCPCLQE